MKKETIFIETKSHYSKDDLPVITVGRFQSNINIKRSCYRENNSSNLLACLRNNTFDLNDTIIDMRQNVYLGKNSSVEKSNWKMGFHNAYSGRTYTISDGFELSSSDFLKIKLPGSGIQPGGVYTIDFHDRNHYIEASEQYEDFQRPSVVLAKGTRVYMHLKAEKIVLLPEVSNCNDNKDYSFLNCVKVNTSKFFKIRILSIFRSGLIQRLGAGIHGISNQIPDFQHVHQQRYQ